MALQDILDLSNTVALALADENQLTTYYFDEQRTLGQQPVLTNMSASNAVGGFSIMAMPDVSIELLAVFVDDRELLKHSELEFEAITRDWRLGTGNPRAYTLDDLSENVFQLYPPPPLDVNPVSTDFAIAFGAGFLPGQVSMLYTEERASIPRWMDVWFALAMLAREFERESNHRDVPFATAAASLSAIVKKMVM